MANYPTRKCSKCGRTHHSRKAVCTCGHRMYTPKRHTKAELQINQSATGNATIVNNVGPVVSTGGMRGLRGEVFQLLDQLRGQYEATVRAVMDKLA